MSMTFRACFVLPAQAGIQRFDAMNLLHSIYLNVMQRIHSIVRLDPRLRGKDGIDPISGKSLHFYELI